MTNLKDKNSDSINDAPVEKIITNGTNFQAFKGIFIEYFEESSIHGFRYIGEQKRPTFDRIVWILAVIISISMCCYLINNLVDQRNNNPVIVTFNDKLTPVWEIPFPTVTICSETKIHMKVLNYTKVYIKLGLLKDITKEEEYLWDGVAQTCVLSSLSFHEEKLLANSSDLIKAMSIAAPTFNETLHKCYWRNEFFNCEEIFDSVLTDEGICFSFNSLKSEHYRTELYNARKKDFIGFEYDNVEDLDWNLENGYNQQADEKTFPVRVIGPGDKESLVLSLRDRKEDEEQLCRNSVRGFKIILHTPGEDPQVWKNFINVPLDQSVSLTIKPKIMTSEDLRHYSPERRQCYYQNERYLRYFKVYTQANCESEWLANMTLSECGCVKFSMPRNSSHPICGYHKLTCVDSVMYTSKEWTINYEKYLNAYNCLPTCISIEYKAELEHQVPINYAQIEESDEGFLNKDNSSYRITKITLKFKEDNFNGLKRSELYSMSDFIANCGGLLGLFMGVSILSLVELVYFLTLRLLTNLKNRRII
ncbi:pickpocket protein 28-like [Episyrphus balteatus]|uniref:pickpocket protein 28-like n=1 Tax=Episyrphus balteatus TaxID=286459 RepID=UPI0024852A59|nr:pickpocket protein 28-like [Episyrphus balteatus]